MGGPLFLLGFLLPLCLAQLLGGAADTRDRFDWHAPAPPEGPGPGGRPGTSDASAGFQL